MRIAPAYDEADAREVLAAISRVRRHLEDQWISDGCEAEPSFGCASCDAVALSRKLEALANSISEDQGIPA